MFGILSYSRSMNLGDEIQSIAAKNLLESLGCAPKYTVDRDTQEIHMIKDEKLKVSEPIHVVMNGWFDSSYCDWPPSDLIDPLIISFHLNDMPKSKDYECLNPYLYEEKKDITLSEWWDKLKTPIGCRDQHTLNKFTAAEMDAYLSGCLTTTILPSKFTPLEKRKKVYMVDLDPQEYHKLPEWIIKEAIRETHIFKSPIREERFAKAQQMLNMYEDALLVVTSRLHVAIPCVALGTPVIFMKSDWKEDCRFDGLIHLIPTFGKDDISSDFKGHKNESIKEVALKKMAADIRAVVSRWAATVRTKDLKLEMTTAEYLKPN